MRRGFQGYQEAVDSRHLQQLHLRRFYALYILRWMFAQTTNM